MRKHLATCLMVLLVLCALTPYVQAKESADAADRKSIQSFLDNVAGMFDRKDVESVVKTVMPGATLRYADGTEMTIEEWHANALREFANIADMKSKFTVEKVTTMGDTKVVAYKELHNYTLTSDKKRKYRSESRWSVTLAKTSQGWTSTHFIEFSEKMTRDGKLVKPVKQRLNPNPL